MCRVCIVTVYFGKLPVYFPLWVCSVKYNSSIDFIVYTDDDFDGSLPPNLQIKRLTLSGLKQRATAKLGLNVCLDRPYKCCDFKPVYGLIFEDDLKEYDYWGHCDIDLIFGDLKSFFLKNRLEKYDRFLTLGHLSLYRNTKEVNMRYEEGGAFVDYETVFCSNNSYAFDEFTGMTSIYMANHYSMFDKRIFLDISPTYHRFTISTRYSLDIKPKNYKYQTFFWENGKVFHIYLKGKKVFLKEYIYIHFQKRGPLKVNFDVVGDKAFFITNNGFYEKKRLPNAKDIMSLNEYPGLFYELLERIRNNLITIRFLIIDKLRRWCR